MALNQRCAGLLASFGWCCDRSIAFIPILLSVLIVIFFGLFFLPIFLGGLLADVWSRFCLWARPSSLVRLPELVGSLPGVIIWGIMAVVVGLVSLDYLGDNSFIVSYIFSGLILLTASMFYLRENHSISMGLKTGLTLRVSGRMYLQLFPFLVFFFWLGRLIFPEEENLFLQAYLRSTIETFPSFQSLGVFGLVVIFAPLVEEFYFRGVLFPCFCQRTGIPRGALLSSLFFALAHGQLAAFPSIWLLGMMLATSYSRTGRLMAPVVLHIGHNCLVLGLNLVFSC